jgi:hypothetical protein
VADVSSTVEYSFNACTGGWHREYIACETGEDRIVMLMLFPVNLIIDL